MFNRLSLFVWLVALVIGAASCSGDGGGGDADSASTVDVSFDGGRDLVTEDDAAADGDAGMLDGASLVDLSGADGGTSDAPGDVAPEQMPLPGPWEDLAGSGPTIREMLGVSTHMKQSAGENAKRDFEFATYEELGGIRIREDFHWHHIEPVDDEWHMEAVATQVEMARPLGVKVLPMLAYGVDWAMEDSAESTIDPAEYAEFAGEVAATFCADIKEYEIWNEPNIERFWSPEPDPAHYGELLAAAADAIREACPDARVASAGFAAADYLDVRGFWWFIDDMMSAGSVTCDTFDILAIHPYTFAQFPPPEHDNVLAEQLVSPGQTWVTQMARDVLAKYGCGDKPVWYTEMGWPSYELTEEDQGRYLARSILLAARDRIEAYFWYTFWDSSPDGGGFRPHENYFGLYGWVGPDGTERRAKPSYEAMKALADILGPSRFARDLGPVLELPNDVYALTFVDDAGDTAVVAVWDGREAPDRWLGGVVDEGGPETSYQLSLPLPDDATAVTVLDIRGAELQTPPVTDSLSLELTISPLYVVVQRGE